MHDENSTRVTLLSENVHVQGRPRKYCSRLELETPRRCMTVSGPGVMITQTERKLPPPPLRAGARLIKTPTFNKTPHYHNSKTRSWRKTPRQARTLPSYVLFLLLDAGAVNFQTPITRCVCICVRVPGVSSVARGSCRLFSLPVASFSRVPLFSKQKPTTPSKQTALPADAAHGYVRIYTHKHTCTSLGCGITGATVTCV